MIERRAKRLMSPRTWETPDAKGFREYAKQHYAEAFKFAFDLANELSASRVGFNLVTDLVFNKVAAPLVYLYESWEILAPEEKAKYSPELAKIHEESKALAEKALPAVAPGVPVVKPEEAAKIPELDLAEIEALPWTSYKTKQLTKRGEAGWCWRSLENAQELVKAIESSEGQRLQLGEYEYRFSGPEKQFVSRRPVKV